MLLQNSCSSQPVSSSEKVELHPSILGVYMCLYAFFKERFIVPHLSLSPPLTAPLPPGCILSMSELAFNTQ